MNNWVQNMGFFVCGAMLSLMVVGLVSAAVMPGMDRWNRRYFVIFFALLTLNIGVFTVDEVVYGNPDLVTAERVVSFFEYLFVVILVPLSTIHLLHACGEDWPRHPLFRSTLALWGAYLLTLVVAQCTTVFYYITPDNQFVYGPWHALLMMPVVMILALNLVYLIRWRGRLSRRLFIVFLIYTLPMLLTLLIRLFLYDILLIGFSNTISIALWGISMYAIIMRDQIDRYLRQQKEIAHQRASVMVLQMRPHFIHNTMTSIYYLCGQDPKKAQQVTLDFNTYLRRNFTAIASDHTIPFSEELEHTRAYLAVEQAQFEERLFVDYDTPHTLFRLPPLTLQPIVENAVKHGMDPEAEPLRISIRTRETDSGSEIVVEDNGPGYEPADDSEPHIALANIRQRLEMMCGGELTILPRDGGGTVVKVTVSSTEK